MLVLLISSSFVVLGFASLYIYWGSQCFRLFWFCGEQDAAADYLPKVAVILPLRGNDPFLLNCLEGILTQDYPNYQVRIIVDHESDPAFNEVKSFLLKHNPPQCEVSLLKNRSGNCGLKNESLIQGMESLDASVEVVAWLDADVIPHKFWIRELVQPLENPDVGVASGVRWYAPRSRNPGTLIRYVWNSAAIVQMLTMDIAWGGSIAMSRDVFHSPSLKKLWSQALWEDTCLRMVVSQLGLKMVFVPEATMVNEESTSLKSCYQFITRQLLNTRLYHPSWKFISILGICSALSQITLVTLTILFLFLGSFSSAAFSIAVLLSASVCVGSVIWWLDTLIRQQIRRRGAILGRLPWSTILVLWPTLALYFVALLAATRTRKVYWRGVVYDVASPFNVQIIHYEPYQNVARLQTVLETDNSSIV